MDELKLEDLTDDERTVLAHTHQNAQLSSADLVELCGFELARVQRMLRKLKTSGAIVFSPVINVYRIGYCYYDLLFTLDLKDSLSGAEFLTFVTHSPLVAHAWQIAGENNYKITLCVKGIAEVLAFFEALYEKFGATVVEKSISARHGSTSFGSKLYFGTGMSYPVFERRITEQAVDIDREENAILHSLSTYYYQSNRELAANLELPQSTVNYKIKRMEDNGVIAGYRYVIRFDALGYQFYEIALQLMGLSPELRSELRQFAAAHKNVRRLDESLGGWDLLFGVELEKDGTIQTLIEELYLRFGKSIASIVDYRLVHWLKESDFPRP